jgi:hypothetical protein
LNLVFSVRRSIDVVIVDGKFRRKAPARYRRYHMMARRNSQASKFNDARPEAPANCAGKGGRYITPAMPLVDMIGLIH